MAKLSKDGKASIVCTDEKYLRRKSDNPYIIDDKCKEVIKALRDAYDAYEGKVQGLAAIQVWRPYRVILVRYKKGREPEICLCPVVLDTIGSKTSMEKCESEPGKIYNVKRPLFAKVAYYTEGRDYVEKWLPFKKARIFCHEVDHLDGILLKDKGVRVDAYINRFSKA